MKTLKVLSNRDKEPRTSQQVYVLDNIMFVPHFEWDGYVGPGYGTSAVKLYRAEELTEMGAVSQMYLLWGGNGVKRPKLYKER